MKILVTGAAGFIGFHLVKKLVSLGHSVTGLDNINDYYNIGLKHDRLIHSGINIDAVQYGKKINSSSFFSYNFIKLDLIDKEELFTIFSEEQFDCVCNLAAQAGVRYSLENPHAYIDSNVYGFLNILEACRIYSLKHLVFASSSSVYGLNEKTPFSVTDTADHPASMYAASKRSNELMVHVYSHLFGIPATGLRFFTVYGPWGRPDMAYYKFANAIFENKPIEVYNNGNMQRDFSYIDDIIEGIVAAIGRIPSKKNGFPPLAIYNLGNNHPEKLLDFIETLEKSLGRIAQKKYVDMQPGDVVATMADIENTRCELGWEPRTSISEGLKLFADWFLEYENIG